MNIAVCDDERAFAARTVKLINDIVDYSSCSYTECYSGEELINKHITIHFDIIFLDVEMNGMNGIDTAKEIRKMDSNVIIVFLTNYQEFAIKGYEVRAYRYLVKNQPEYVYRAQILSIFDEYFLNHQVFEINSKNKISFILLSDICFFEIVNKTVTVHTMSNTIDYCGKLSDIEHRLKDNNLFVKPHKSFLINIALISSINTADITMKNNESVNLSRNYKKNVINRYISFMTGR